MKSLIILVLIFCFFDLNVSGQSDAQINEYNSIFSKIMGFNISEAERIKQIEQYVPDAFFQKKGFSALSAAIGTKNMHFIEYILAKPGVNPAELGYSKESILSYLPWEDYKIVKSGTCIQADTITRLRKQITLLLISKGASLSLQDANGNNVITRAIYNKDLDFVQFIYEKNENKLVNSPNLLYGACSTGCVDIVSWLVDHGENVNTTNSYEGSAIGSSVNNPTIVSYLISKGANVNQANSHGWTPLMYAVNRGNLESVQLLLNAGANINATNDKGWNALQVAKEYKQKEISKLLKKIMEQK